MRRSVPLKWVNLMLVQLISIVASPLIAQFNGLDKFIQNELEGRALVSEQRIDLSKLKLSNSTFGLASSDVDKGLRDSLAQLGLHPFLSIKAVSKVDHTSLSLGGTSSVGIVNKYSYFVGSFEVCSVGIKTIQNLSGETVVVGSIPQVDQVVQVSAWDWPDHVQAQRVAFENLSQLSGQGIQDIKTMNASKCLYNDQGYLEPVWNFVISADGLQYQVYASHSKVFAINQRFFDLSTATLQAYTLNSTGSQSNFTVTVDGSGKLTNDYFKTAIGSGEERLTLSNNAYSYPGSLSVNFAEASNFAYVNRHYDFAVSNGYVWQGLKPITVEVRAATKDGKGNNALYTPSDGVNPPKIQVGKGDGSLLQKLEFDSDVVSHEFGHHLVYQSITDIAGEGLVLHEGLADFLTMARTGDDCLGESICPTGTSMTSCILASNRCLRTAANTFVYGEAPYTSYSSSPHLQGQLVSGYLWDMRKNGSIPSDTLSKYVMQAITYLPSNADMKSFVAAMLYTDSANGGTYGAVMETIGAARGLSAAALEINTADLKSSITAGKSSSSSESSSSSKKGGIFGCGIIKGAESSTSSFIWLLLLGFPMLLAMMPKPKLVKVKARKAK